MSGSKLALASLIASLLLPIGCGSDAPPAAPAPATSGAFPAGSAAKPAGSAQPAKAGAKGAPTAEPIKPEDMPPKVDFQEADFTETERSRDPFRSYAKAFAEEQRTKVRSQREVILDQYSVDELRLIGIVTRLDPARAMVVDPTGKGHVVTRGQFIGRAEVVQGGASGADYEINWRVERIRESDVVLVREDPANPDVPSATRVLPLRAGVEEQQEEEALEKATE